MRTLKAAALYFAIVFGAGFVLGTVRVIGIVPRFGPRIAELIEAPLMLMVIILAANWVVRRVSLPATLPARLGAGLIALGLLLATEFTVVLKVRHLTISEYFDSRDPLATTVYIALLLVFAVMPFFVANK